MTNNKNYRYQVFEKASLARNFEEQVITNVKNKKIKIPVYVSAGQEFIASTIATICKLKKIKPLIFGQHRCHSTYLTFDGDKGKLIDELLQRKTGCTKGMGGSASIHSTKINMYGHDGLMGSNGPIGVGACYATKKPTIIFLGDAAAEEDYVLGALGWASTKNLPLLVVVEDNNYSILTEKKVRRNWEMSDVAKAFKMKGFNCDDNPMNIYKYSKFFFKQPCLLNINTNRIYWHAGAGKDSEKTFDRYKSEKKILGTRADLIDHKTKKLIKNLWKKHLEK
ncbi:thiamine pyrophosphate-dependent enzyme [Candidatus Pelagibacter sp. Uisw_130]|uniref:thiamine pyrophosphate-dependent enzyme n=1 Tax=Candidatus Pelagibacter sp. Uisw_130 TaxID=3230989 RepID=UPI0039EB15AA